MKANDNIRNKAMMAMKAVTAGALLFAGVACSGDTDDTEETWNVAEQDAGSDAEDDDTGPLCNAQESTGECPEGCTQENDVDCCEEIDSEWEWCDWIDGYCSCAIMGPFVPPSMPDSIDLRPSAI